jgi:hypothetical protein
MSLETPNHFDPVDNDFGDFPSMLVVMKRRRRRSGPMSKETKSSGRYCYASIIFTLH